MQRSSTRRGGGEYQGPKIYTTGKKEFVDMGDIYRETTKNVPQAKSEALNLIVGMVFRKSLEKMNKRMLPLSKRSKGFSKKLELCKNETREGGDFLSESHYLFWEPGPAMDY